MPSIKSNFAWSTALTAASYLFQLITFPYVTRVLGVEGIGNYQFATAVIDYFCVFSMLGISTLGIREIAKTRGDRVAMSRVFNDLFFLNLSSTLFCIIVLVLLIQVLPSFVAHNKLLYIGTARILFNSLLIEWFFKGIEDFRFITIRAVMVRILYVIAVFIFVRHKEDYDIYFLLTTITVIVNAIINYYYLGKYVTVSFHGVDFRIYIKPYLVLGLYIVLTAMYTSFNVMFLGAKCGDVEVGYYTTATKLYALIMAVFSSFTGVMLPRMSSLLAEGDETAFLNMTSKSIDFLLLLSIPIILFVEVYAPSLILLIAGIGYEGAIVPMRIVIPLMMIIGYEQIVVLQMLMPLQKDNAILVNSLVGAVVGLTLNIILVPLFASIGSSIVWCISELAVLLSAQHYIKKYIGYRFPLRKVLSSVLLLSPSMILCYFVDVNITSNLISMFIGLIIIVVYSFLVEYFILKNELLRESTRILFNQVENVRSRVNSL